MSMLLTEVPRPNEGLAILHCGHEESVSWWNRTPRVANCSTCGKRRVRIDALTPTAEANISPGFAEMLRSVDAAITYLDAEAERAADIASNFPEHNADMHNLIGAMAGLHAVLGRVRAALLDEERL